MTRRCAPSFAAAPAVPTTAVFLLANFGSCIAGELQACCVKSLRCRLGRASGDAGGGAAPAALTRAAHAAGPGEDARGLHAGGAGARVCRHARAGARPRARLLGADASAPGFVACGERAGRVPALSSRGRAGERGPCAQPGVTTDTIDKAVHKMIVENGAYPSPLTYGACVSPAPHPRHKRARTGARAASPASPATLTFRSAARQPVQPLSHAPGSATARFSPLCAAHRAPQPRAYHCACEGGGARAQATSRRACARR